MPVKLSKKSMAKTDDEKWEGRFERWGVALPSRDTHGTEEDIRNNLTPLKVKKWWMEGNKLMADTDQGKYCQFLPTDVICTGVGSDGMPQLTRIKV